MIRSVLICLMVFLSGELVFERSIQTDASDFNVDNLGNIYLIHANYIERINASNSAKFRTSEMNFGNIDYLDLTNPLKPFIHYRGIGKIVVLDNTLSQQGEAIDLWSYGFTQVEMVAGSRGDAYWLWDSRNSELIRVDATFNRIGSTGNLSVLLGKTINPVQIIERGQHLYMRDPNLGVLVFDVYGKYKSTLSILPDHDIQIIDNDLVYQLGNQLHILASDWITEDQLTLPEIPDSRVIWLKQRCYFLKKSEGLQIFRLK